MINKSNRYLLGERFVFSPSDSSLVDLHENEDLIRLGSNECRVLMVLIEEPHAIVTRNRIHDFVWRKQGFEVDDSSLTQSISTLRKALKDSTKIPLFVKTVPKRGYQVICSVEVYDDQAVETPKHTMSANVENEQVFTSDDFHHDIEDPQPVNDSALEANTPTEPTPGQTSNIKGKLPLSALLTLLLALLVPVAFYVASTPKSEAFRQILTVANVPVSIPVTNVRIKQWKPLVQRCVEQYIETYGKARQLEEVIVTGGQENRISLNYIHSAENADLNRTYVLLTSHEESDAICH